jgi:O-antigen ligase
VTSIRQVALGLLCLLVLSGSLAVLALNGNEDRALVALLGAFVAVVFFLRPALAIVAFLASFLTTYRGVFTTEGYLTPNNLLGLFLALLLLLKLHHDRDFWFLKDPVLLVYATLVAWILLVSRVAEIGLYNPAPELDTTIMMRHMLLSRFVFLFFFVYFVHTVRDVKLVLFTTVALILVTAVTGLQSSLEAVDQPGLRAKGQVGIQAGGNPNRLAFFCIAAMSVLWYYRRAVRSRVVSGTLILIIPVLALTTLLAGSRSGLLTLVLFFFLIGVEGRFSVKRQIQTLVVGVTVIALGTSLLTTYHSERITNVVPGGRPTQGSGSTETRLATMSHGFRMIMDSPVLGVGIGNFMWKRLQYSMLTTPPHNSYLWAAAEAGIPALALYLLLFALTLKRLLGVERATADLEIRMIARGLRMALIILLFFSFFADFWLHVFTYLVVGMAIVLKRLQEREVTALARARVHAPAPATAGVAPA